MHNVKSAILEDDIKDCPYCGAKYDVTMSKCLASALAELEAKDKETARIDRLQQACIDRLTRKNDELGAERVVMDRWMIAAKGLLVSCNTICKLGAPTSDLRNLGEAIDELLGRM